MKQFFTIFLCLLLAASAAGQELKPKQDTSGKWGYVDAQGNTVIPYQYDDAGNFRENVAWVKLNFEYGYINQQGKMVIPCRYDYAQDFMEGLARVKLNGKYGYINNQGETVIPCKYDWIESFIDGMARVELNGKKGYIDKQGKEVIPCIYSEMENFVDDMARVELNGKWGYIDKQGEDVIPCIYNKIGDFSKGNLARVELNEKVGYINKRGEIVIPCQYDDVEYFREDYARVKLNNKWGYVNLQGDWFDYVGPFIDGLAEVKVNNKRGFINKQGDRLDQIDPFIGDLARVKSNNKYGYINKHGKIVIPCRYDDIGPFSEGLAVAKLNNKWGYINCQGEEVIPCVYNEMGNFMEGLAAVELNGKKGYINRRGDWFDTEAEGRKWLAQPLFSEFAKTYVESRINAWQKKGEFEKTSDWQARVNEATRNRKINDLTHEAEQQFIRESTEIMNYNLGQYDADNEVYLITGNNKELLVPVPIAEAPAFKQNWESIVKTPKYFIENDRLAVAEVAFAMPGGKTYRYSNAASLQYTTAEVSYNFDPIEIAVPETTAPAAGRQTVNRVTVTAGKSDVDVNIPQGRTTRDRTFAVIIANENYTKLSPVVYALNDGKTFGQYCRQTLGLPETNIRYYGDATYGTMLAAMSDIKKIATAYEGDIEVLFYYAGHGAPDEQQEAYLMPVDAYGVGSEACYSLARLYKELGGLGARRVTVFLDACFSGSTREGTMLASARGVAIKPRSASPTGNMVVFTAAQGDETALPYGSQGHGLFTYYLLKKLQESGGKVTFGELGDYLTEQVSRRSQVVNRKSQTPAVLVSPSLGATWQTTPLVQ